MDASGIVQVTMMEAYRCLPEFRGTTNSELAGWLRKILARNIADAFRALGRKKRDINRELSLEERLDETCSKLDQWLAAVQTSPSSRAARNETLLQLATALSALPEAQREAIELHHLQGLTLAETAEQLDRTTASVAGLLRRGLGRLRELMDHSTVYRGS